VAGKRLSAANTGGRCNCTVPRDILVANLSCHGGDDVVAIDR